MGGKKEFTPEQNTGKLREAGVFLSKGSVVEDVCRKLEVKDVPLLSMAEALR